MSNIVYGVNPPTDPIAGVTHFVDLYTDTMYEYKNGSWVAIFRHGIPLDADGNYIRDDIYGY